MNNDPKNLNPWDHWINDPSSPQQEKKDSREGKYNENLTKQPLIHREKRALLDEFGQQIPPPDTRKEASEQTLTNYEIREIDLTFGAEPAPIDEQQVNPLVQMEEEAPYKPSGFDDRFPHLPLVARILSIVAPGSGEIYNGEDVSFVESIKKAVCITPWIRSAKNAGLSAEQIRAYKKPWPPKHSLRDGVVRAILFWLSIGATISTVIIVAYIIHTKELVSGQVDTTQRTTDAIAVSRAIEEANIGVRKGRIEAYATAANAAQKEREQGETMPIEERVKRLYAIGYESCVARDYAKCAAIMRRVSNLDKSSVDAIRLQVWASAQQQGNHLDMPEVKAVTWDELEGEK